MTSLPNSHVVSTSEVIIELLLSPFRALGNGLIAMAERNPRLIAVEKLSQISDEELAAQGLTRVQAVQQVLGTHY